MKKILFLLIAILLIFTFNIEGKKKVKKEISKSSLKIKIEDMNKNKVKENLLKNLSIDFKRRKLEGITIDIKYLFRLKELEGYYFVKLIARDLKKKIDEITYLITNGNNIITKAMDMPNNITLIPKYKYLYESYKIDSKGLALIYGNIDAEDKIVCVLDFECAGCKFTWEMLREELVNKNVAVYILHLPIPSHKKTNLFSRILEVGFEFDNNFLDPLFFENFDKKTDKEIIAFFAEMTDTPGQFIKLVNSDKIKKRIESQVQRALSMGVDSTPTIYINNKRISGFDQNLLRFALSEIK